MNGSLGAQGRAASGHCLPQWHFMRLPGSESHSGYQNSVQSSAADRPPVGHTRMMPKRETDAGRSMGQLREVRMGRLAASFGDVHRSCSTLGPAPAAMVVSAPDGDADDGSDGFADDP